MDEDAFWELIERSGREARTRKKRLAWLDDELSRRSAEEIADFDTRWDSVRNRACTWDYGSGGQVSYKPSQGS